MDAGRGMLSFPSSQALGGGGTMPNFGIFWIQNFHFERKRENIARIATVRKGVFSRKS